MKNLVVSVGSCLLLTACTSVTVKRPDPALSIKHVCIQENPKVWVGGFLPVLREGFDRQGIKTKVYSGTNPEDCEYMLTYTALQSWDFAPYLSDAELWLEKNGQQVAYAEYHLVGKGGLSLMKWQGKKENGPSYRRTSTAMSKVGAVIDISILLGREYGDMVPCFSIPTGLERVL